MRMVMRRRHYSRRTEEAYTGWVARYVRYHRLRHPTELSAQDVRAFLGHLAAERQCSASTQNQALNALVFLYRHVLEHELGEIGPFDRARRRRHLPDVLSRSEVDQLLCRLSGMPRLVVQLLYGSGLRLLEALNLRTKDVDLERRQLLVRRGKGRADRVTILPECLHARLRAHLEFVRHLASRDVAQGHGHVMLPGAFGRKASRASRALTWQFFFPASRPSQDPVTGLTGRFHLHETAVQRAVARAARSSGLAKRVTCHTLRHSFATELLQGGTDIRTIQKLLGHKDVRTTMLYTHLIDRGPYGVRSPLDGPGR